MTAPLVSVALPVYNGERFLAEMIESLLLGQSVGDFELLVYDTASTDATKSIVRGVHPPVPPHRPPPVASGRTVGRAGASADASRVGPVFRALLVLMSWAPFGRSAAGAHAQQTGAPGRRSREVIDRCVCEGTI